MKISDESLQASMNAYWAAVQAWEADKTEENRAILDVNAKIYKAKYREYCQERNRQG